MRANAGPFFNNADFNLAKRAALTSAFGHRLIMLSDEPRQVQRAAQVRRPRADKHHVHLDLLSLHSDDPQPCVLDKIMMKEL